MDSVKKMVIQDKLLDLYDHIRYYGRRDIEASAAHFFEQNQNPIVNHWQDIRSFFDIWDLFRTLAKEPSFEDFTAAMDAQNIREDWLFNRQQRQVFFDKKELEIQARFLLDFLISINDYFELEIELIERGYALYAA